MAHEELDRAASQRPCGTVRGDGVLAAAGKGGEGVFVEAASGRIV